MVLWRAKKVRVLWFLTLALDRGRFLFYTFPSFANSRNSHAASQIGLGTTSSTCVALSPRGVLTFTNPSLTVYDPWIARPLNPVVICVQSVKSAIARGPAHILSLIQTALGVHPAKARKHSLRTLDAARRIAVNIVRLPVLLRKSDWAAGQAAVCPLGRSLNAIAIKIKIAAEAGHPTNSYS
jgi:hypothetical protein